MLNASYATYFGLRQAPFSTAPDPDFIYPSWEHEAAMHKVRYAIGSRAGVALVWGHYGTGKTTVAFKILSEMRTDPAVRVYYWNAPSVRTPPQFYRRLCEGFGVQPHRQRNAADLRDAFEGFLVDEFEADRHVVLLLDEADRISADNLHTLLELSNFQTPKAKLAQVILFAPLTFQRRLQQKPALLSRVGIVCTLDALAPHDAREMIYFRLEVAGALPDRARKLIPPPLTESIYDITQGVPRDITVLCNALLLEAAIRRLPAATPEALTAAVKELGTKNWRARDLFRTATEGG